MVLIGCRIVQRPILTNVSEAAATPTAKLEKLFIAEVSAVDDPANAVPGWMVAKAADSLSDAEVAGIEVDLASEEDATSIVEKIKGLLFGKENDVTKDELTAALEERDNALVEKMTEIVKASVEPAPASEAATEAPAAEAAPAPAEVEPAVEQTFSLTAEDIAKAIEDGIQPVLEILDKTLDRVEALESRSATRKSIDGQEDGSEEPPAETVKTAIAKALGHGARA